MSRFVTAAFAALGLASAPVLAAEWEVLGGSYSKSGQLFGAYNFTDGEVTEKSVVSFSGPEGGGPVHSGAWVLRNSADPASSTELFYFNEPVQVDLTAGQERIKVKGMQYLGTYLPVNDGSDRFGGWLYESAIGYDLTPARVEDDYSLGTSTVVFDSWAPLVVNGDGSYTATWKFDFSGYQTPHPAQNGTADDFGTMSITFHAAPVPEPELAALFAIGLVGVAVATRRRRVAWGKA